VCKIRAVICFWEVDSIKFVGMEYPKKYFQVRYFAMPLAMLIFPVLFSQSCFAQDPNPPPNSNLKHFTPVFLLNITPKSGGKTYTLFSKTRVTMAMENGTEVSGRVRGVGRDSISIDYKSFAVKDISELRFNPGSALGVAAAIATTAGLVAIAVSVDGGKDGVRSSTENTIFFGGIGLTVIGAAVLIPTYFIKKRFSRSEYDFTAVMIGGY
jgi:hypothetical protein